MFYSYWELPDWENKDVKVTREWVHRDKEVLSLREDIKIFIVRRPKRNGWENVHEGSLINVTKMNTDKKRAVLVLNQIDGRDQ